MFKMKKNININNNNYYKISLESSIKDMIKYVENRQRYDPLVIGFENFHRKNPLKRERSDKCCMI